MNELIQILAAELKEKFPHQSAIFARDYRFPDLPNKIKVAIGMRRVGKTYFLFQTMHQLMAEQSIPWQRILYLNFEDDRLNPCSRQQLSDLLEAFYKLYPENHDHCCYLFLDEIQYVEDWALVVRRFFDSKKVQIYITGSSAKLLSKEIATSLRGRAFSIEIWPYSFKEYLAVNNVVVQTELFGQKTQDLLQKHLRDYIETGGFPEIINIAPALRRQILQDYTELVIFRDIVERHNITNISLIKYLIKCLVKQVGANFSVNKFANDIKSQGLSGAKNTIYDYLSYIEDAYLAFLVPLYSESLKKISSNPKKNYAIDTGLVKAFSFSLNHNFGHLFENVLFLELRRQGHKIHYYLTKERYEIDFLTEDPLGKQQLFQIVWDDRDEKTMAREIRALEAAKKELNLPGRIITPVDFCKLVYKEIS